MDNRYTYYKKAFEGRVMPFAFVDLDAFDRNVQDILQRAGDMSIRVASKSVRCLPLLQRVLAASEQFRGVMAYSLREAVFLSQAGLDDILVAYPAWGGIPSSGVLEELRASKRIILMVDCQEHVVHLDHLGQEANVTIPVCLELDMSSTFPGIHFGVRRSTIRTPEQALAVAHATRAAAHVSLDGLMGYEAQIAGLQDRVPGSFLKNRLVRFLKGRSLREVVLRRSAVLATLKEDGHALRFVNGGGTGSVETTTQEEPVTEVAVGSAFYSPTLFDHYDRFRHLPAAGFAIEVVRRPARYIYACSGGGYVASGPSGSDRLPKPYLPEGASLLRQEGAGEVQTPIAYSGPEPLNLGDPVFLRHSKAGELCERFRSLLLVSKGQVVDEVPTYRGQEQCFL